jgi:hypothetical protein
MKVVASIEATAYKGARPIRYWICTLLCGHKKASRLGARTAPKRMKCEQGCER